jgi:hypothetical protein
LAGKTVAIAISKYGAITKAKLASIAIEGAAFASPDVAALSQRKRANKTSFAIP